MVVAGRIGVRKTDSVSTREKVATLDERHVWIDTDLAGRSVIDLEDWNYEATSDNSVAHLGALDEDVPAIVQAWLTGATVEECVRLGGRQIPELK